MNQDIIGVPAKIRLKDIDISYNNMSIVINEVYSSSYTTSSTSVNTANHLTNPPHFNFLNANNKKLFSFGNRDIVEYNINELIVFYITKTS